MRENQIEINFIEKCKKMSFQELESYIEDSFEKLESNENLIYKIPTDKNTYESLLSLLETKFNNDYLIQIKLNNLIKTSDYFTQVKKITLKEDVGEINLNLHIKDAEEALENLLKGSFAGNELARNIMNSSARYNEKMRVLSRISETQIKKIAEDFKPFDFSSLVFSDTEKKQMDLKIHSELENCKEQILRLTNLRKSSIKKVQLQKHSKSEIRKLHELIGVTNKQLKYYRERQNELNKRKTTEEFNKGHD